MSSQRKIDSARRNGALSKGPVTDAGKRASSQNGFTHGILTKTIVLEGESKERFDELHCSLIAEFQPRTTTEAALVETMTIARWRLLRVLAIQKASLDLEMARQETELAPAYRAALVFKELADNSRLLELLNRYEISYDRQFSRALSLLLKLRANSPQPTEPLPNTLSAVTSGTFEENTAFPSEPNPKNEHSSGAGPANRPERRAAASPAAHDPELRHTADDLIDELRTLGYRVEPYPQPEHRDPSSLNPADSAD
jgi:hypothetical protein